ncbi:hypothetical protein AVEN_162424-1, partial [Araneus ventricosus]
FVNKMLCGESAECPICLYEIRGEWKRLLCNHVYHHSCIDSWLHSHAHCPMCRAPHMPNLYQRVVRYI